jgi:hypothetical protein
MGALEGTGPKVPDSKASFTSMAANCTPFSIMNSIRRRSARYSSVLL